MLRAQIEKDSEKELYFEKIFFEDCYYNKMSFRKIIKILQSS